MALGRHYTIAAALGSRPQRESFEMSPSSFICDVKSQDKFGYRRYYCPSVVQASWLLTTISVLLLCYYSSTLAEFTATN